MLGDFLVQNRAEIIARTRARVAERLAPRPTEQELADGIPAFIDQIVETLGAPGALGGSIAAGASLHGAELLRRGFTLAQVVHDYGGVCQAVTELAAEKKAAISADDFHTFNRCLDEAIAGAVTEYQRQREISIADMNTERLGDLAHELRNALGGALMSFDILRRGAVGYAGATAAVLARSLGRLSRLIDSSLVQVRLEVGAQRVEVISVRQIVEDVEVEAAMEASERQMSLAVLPVADGVDVRVDRQLIAAALGNLLQNAFKFGRAGGRVTLRTSATAERVLIAVEDECGGLPPGTGERLFLRFEQAGADRSGVGLGLSISRRSVEAMGGEVRVLDLPGQGCVFTIDLPRA